MLALDDGRSESLDGVLKGVRGSPLPLGTGGSVFAVDEGVRSAPKVNFDGGAERGERGDSGRGRDGRRIRGRDADGGPTDLLKFVVTEGRDGVGGVTAARFVTYLVLFMGTKMPAPGTVVLK
jgi:hypothetical protein